MSPATTTTASTSNSKKRPRSPSTSSSTSSSSPPPRSLAHEKLSEALDLIAKADAEDTPIVRRLLRECIEHADQQADKDDNNTILSTASTYLAHLQEAQDDDRRLPPRALYEQALQAWPGNPDAAYALANIVKAEAKTEGDLNKVEALLRVAAGEEEEEEEEEGDEQEQGEEEGKEEEGKEEEEAEHEEENSTTHVATGANAEEEEEEEQEENSTTHVATGGNAEEEEEEEQEEDEPSRHQRRLAQEDLALLLLQQEGRHPHADALLQRLGFSHRLATHVLAYSLPSPSPASLPPAATPFLRVYADVLPLPALRAMQRLFAPSAAFWEDHGYFRREQGYFSYLLPLPPASSPTSSSSLSSSSSSSSSSCLPPLPSSPSGAAAVQALPSCMAIEAIIQHHLLPLAKHAFPHLFSSSSSSSSSSFPSSSSSNPPLTLTAEWWAHCRRHAEGHQLHFDSLDEGKGYVRHPLVSCVLYLSEAQGVGGPTLMTDQTLTDRRLARRGWLCHGKANRVCLFDARHLHGVLPGRGVPPEEGREGGREEGEGEGRRRITFMVGIWKGEVPARPAAPPQGRKCPSKGVGGTEEEEEEEEEKERPGANMSVPVPPFSEETPCPRWLQAAMEAGREVEVGREGGAMTPKLATGGLAAVDKIWQRVDGKEGGREGGAKDERPPWYHDCFQGF